MVELKDYEGRKLASAMDLHKALGIKKKFSTWFKQNKERAMLEDVTDFVSYKKQSTGGRPSTDYYLTERAALDLVLISGGKNAKQVRDELIKIFQSRKSLNLITTDEAALAFEYIKFFKYIENQRQALAEHQEVFIQANGVSKYIYADFAKYRAQIVGWDKKKVDEAVKLYLSEHYSDSLRGIVKRNMSEKLSIVDINEAIRVSILDLLFSRGTESNLANNFANMVKDLAKKMNTIAYRKNENNLFQHKEELHLPKAIANN